MQVFLVDGTYELFRHHFGQPPRRATDGTEVAATRGVLLTVLSMLEEGATHLGVATDHVVESFRNELWEDYKTSEGMPEMLLAQFPLVDRGLAALGVRLWPMVDLEADDALASAAAIAAEDPRVTRVAICSPDKDLAQCVRGTRVVQVDRRTGTVTGETGVWEKFGVGPASIPDWLALVGDSADGFPGLPGWGKRSAAAVLAHYGSIEAIPRDAAEWDPAVRAHVRRAGHLASVLAREHDDALLFRRLATLRIEPGLLRDVDELRWQGPTAELEPFSAWLRDDRIPERARSLAAERRSVAGSS